MDKSFHLASLTKTVEERGVVHVAGGPGRNDEKGQMRQVQERMGSWGIQMFREEV